MANLKKFLYNDNIGELPVDANGKSVPALLFANSIKNDKFGELYLFNNFGISGTNTMTMTSEISTHYVENNSSIQDHWALPPVSYTLTGYVGEVVYRPAKKISGWLEDKIENYAQPLLMIAPITSSYVTTALNITQQIEETYAKYSRYAERLMRTIGNWQNKTVTNNSNQQEIYKNLRTIRDNRILVDVYTPYDTLKNMAITSIIMAQDENSNYRTNITITLQEYREINTSVREATTEEKNKLVKSQTADVVNSGVAKTKEAETTWMYDRLSPDGKLPVKYWKGE